MPKNPIADLAADDELTRQLYDMIMATVEPELCIHALDGLVEKYKNESVEEHAKRMQRYEDAYVQFEETFNGFVQEVATKSHSYKKQALQEKEGNERSSEERVLTSLTAKFQS